ncbi:MAG: SCP-like extracellular [Legionella sp.]|nr:MAG: SCP-like extracellular [Legionella sp.]
MNQFRVGHGLNPLHMNSVLTKEAMSHSIDMAKHRVNFGHDGFSQRMEHLHQHIATAQSGAENVAFNYKTAKIVADGWIHSPGHRRNILGHYDQTGIGIAYDTSGRPYFTQLFLKTNT